jgi:lipid-A-disaccharide synthase-like uncharacterized protein
MVRILAVTLIFWSLVFYVGRTLYLGLKSGKMGHSDSSRYASRKTNPVGFWALAILFTSMIGMFVMAWLHSIAL